MEVVLVCEANARTSGQVVSLCSIHVDGLWPTPLSGSPAAAISPGKASPGWEQPLCPSSCPSASLPTASVGQPLSPNDFPHQKLRDTKPAPFGSCFLCYQSSLEKKDEKCNLSAEQTFPRLLPSETLFVENFKVVANNSGWEGSEAKNTADLPSLYSCWKALAGKKQMLCGK